MSPRGLCYLLSCSHFSTDQHPASYRSSKITLRLPGVQGVVYEGNIVHNTDGQYCDVTECGQDQNDDVGWEGCMVPVRPGRRC